MTSSTFPPGPTFKSEWKRPFREVSEEISQGLLVHVRKRFERFGDIYFLANRTPVYVTRHPDHVHEVLVTRASSFKKRAQDLDTFLGQGLLTSDGELWRKQRRLIQPAFSHANLVRYAEVMVDLTQQTLAGWRHGEQRDLNREMMELTLAVVCKAVLDYDARRGANDVVAHAMSVLQGTAGLDVLPRWLPNPIHARKKKAADAMDEVIYAIIDERKENPGDDLVSQLLAGTDGEGMERQQLRDELVTLFLAGHETTALALTWAFFLLAQSPGEEAVLHQELDEVLGDRPPTFADLEHLTLPGLIVQESMRMFPPLYFLPRVAKEDTEVGGYPLAAGSEVLLWIYFMHHDERWFPKPGEFRPQRFLPNSDMLRHRHAYAPFGAGPRACLGKNFALIEAQLLLAAIAQRFRVRLVPGQDVKLNPRVTLGPRAPIQMILEARRR
ncbi:MAG: cytochrome P450 [Deltaproteobacteria bacterium]|nr:cytochrome P450 [Deltaproteobacteria bacterium]